MQRSGRLSRSLEARAGLLAALVLTVLTGGAASAVALEESASGAGRSPASAAVSSAVTVAPRVLVETDLSIGVAWEVPATTVEAPVEPPVAPPVAAFAAAPDPLCSGNGWQQRRGEAALGSLRRPADADGFRLSFEPGRSGVIGLAVLDQGRMQVFVRSCADLPSSLLRHVVAHELGHLVDAARLTDDQRAQWRAVRGIPADSPWYGCNACTDFATPAGDFAEVYAQWQTGAGSNRSELAGSPSPTELADLAARFF